MEFEMPKEITSIIKVIGVGGGGSNAVNYMYNLGIRGVDFVVCNTDKQALDISPVPLKIQLGSDLTEGRGAGSSPEIGKEAALESINDIKDILSSNTRMVFVTAGMGGGTGTGAAPVIAQAARELGILTVGIVTIPFNFEGRRRRQQAEDGIEQIRNYVDTLLIINNEKLREITGNMKVTEAFAKADNILTTAAKSIADVISVTGNINVDFNDVKTVMKDSGVAIMGSGKASGEGRAEECVELALQSPLLNDNDISGANYVLLNITYNKEEVSMEEISIITDFVQEQAGNTAEIIFGHGADPTLEDELCVTIIATGFKESLHTNTEKRAEPKKNVLVEQPKNEIQNLLISPTETINIKEEKPIEMFVKKVEPVENKTTHHVPSFDEIKNFNDNNDNKSEETRNSNEFTFEINNESKQEEPIITKYTLGEEKPKVEKEEVHEHKGMSTKETQEMSEARLQRIREISAALKNPDGLSKFEKEPAFMRNNLDIDQTVPSQEDNISRYTINKDGEENRLKGNSFLNDNVD